MSCTANISSVSTLAPSGNSAAPQPQPPESQPPGDISPLRAWWAVAVLVLAYTLSYVDRMIIALMVEPLRADLGLSDTQVSLLQGLAFAAFYTSLSIPIATLADRRARSAIVAVGVAFWSAMTAACGLASSFGQLFLARMGVGVGEAALGPASYSLIADLFPEEKRGRAMAVFSTGVSIGGGLALIIGGLVIGFAAASGYYDTPFGQMRSWQLVFLMLGPPGILVALLTLTIAEPRRQAPRPRELPPILPFLKREWRTVALLFVGNAISGMIMTAILSWAPTNPIRSFGIGPAEVGRMLGIGLLLLGALGAIVGGWWTDRGTASGDVTAPLRTVMLNIALMSASGIAGTLMPSPELAAIAYSFAFFFGAAAYPAGAVMIQKLAPAPLRARLSALYLFVVTILSLALGPTVVALFTDYVFGDPALLGRSLIAFIAIAGPLGVAALWLGQSAYRRSLDRQETPS